jgi:hypothetical protein
MHSATVARSEGGEREWLQVNALLLYVDFDWSLVEMEVMI